MGNQTNFRVSLRNSKQILSLLIAILMVMTGFFAPVPQAQAARTLTEGNSGRALHFVPNAGQTNARVRFQTDAMGGTAFFTADEVVLVLPVSAEAGRTGKLATSEVMRSSAALAAKTVVTRMRFEGANPAPAIVSGQAQPGVLNIVEGNNPAQWRTGLKDYSSITYTGLYKGIDLRYQGADSRLKGTYLVAAGADPALILWRYQGADTVQVAANGDLKLNLASGKATLVEKAPVAWQEIQGKRVDVPVRYDLRADGSVRFAVGSYNTAYALTIDPTLEYTTYLGGSGADRIYAIAVDPNTGDVYVAGETSSTDFPGSSTESGVTGPGTYPNVFVACIAADGQTTRYRTILGGTNADKGLAIRVQNGQASLTGFTYSTDFPTSSSTKPGMLDAYKTQSSGDADMFVVVLNANGTPKYSTYLGGRGADIAYGLAQGADGALFIAGSSEGSFPGTVPQGGADALVLKLDPNAGVNGLKYARRLGGFYTETARSIAVDNSGSVYITGQTASDGTDNTTPFPVTNGSLQPQAGEGTDAFIVKLDASGAETYGSFLGGSGVDEGLGIAVQPTGNVVYLTGSTISNNFPGTTGTPSGQDAFVSKVDLQAGKIVYSRLLGSPGVDQGYAISVDASGSAYVIGSTSSTDFYSLNPLPEMAGKGGNVDAFVTRFDPDGNPSYSTRIGGSADEAGTGLAVVQSGQGSKVYAAGYTNSTDFPMVATSIQPASAGSDDGFVVRISNTRPRIDVNPSHPGNITFTEDGPAVAVVIANDLAITANDAQTLAYAEARFVDSGGSPVVPSDGSLETLNVALSSGIAGSYSPATGILHLTGVKGTTKADFEAVLRTLTYNNTAQAPHTSTRRVAFEVNDGLNSNDPLTFVNIDVVGVNDAPQVTVPQQSANAVEETGLTVSGISVADIDSGTGQVKVSLSVPAQAGTLLIANPGGAAVSGSGSSLDLTGSLSEINAALQSLQFTGALDFNGSTTLTVTADDQGNSPIPAKTDSQTLTINVQPVNDAPVVPATPPTIQTLEDHAVTVSIITDLGVDDRKDTTTPPASAGAVPFVPVASLTTITAPANGALAYDTTLGTLTYTPKADFFGSDQFIYEVCDLGSGTPASTCAQQTVQVVVTNVNDAPSFKKGADVKVVEDSGPYSESAWATEISAGPNETDALTFTTSSDNPGLFSAAPVVDSQSGTLTFTPAGNQYGVANVTVVLHDLGGADNQGSDTSAAQTFKITVTPVNDAPSFSKGADVTVDEGSGSTGLPGWATSISAGPNEADQQSGLSFSVTNDNAALFSSAPVITISSTNPSQGDLSFTLADHANGSALVTVTLNDHGGTIDGGQEKDTQTFRITVSPVNDAPVGPAAAAVNTVEDTPKVLQIVDDLGMSDSLDTSAPADTTAAAPFLPVKAITIDAGPASGSIDPVNDIHLSAGTITYHPDAHFFGDDSFTYTVCDTGTGTPASQCKSQTVNITVSGVNNPPEFIKGADVTVQEDSGSVTVSGWATGINPGPGEAAEQSLLGFTISSDNPALFASSPAITINQADPTTGDLTFQPADEANGTATVTVTLQDDGGTANNGKDSFTQTFQITVQPVNDAPVGPQSQPTVQAWEDTPLTLSITSDLGMNDGKDTALPGAKPFPPVASITITHSPAHGSIDPLKDINLTSGTITYHPASDFYGSDSFSFTVCDLGTGTGTPDSACSDEQTVSVDVQSINDAPFFTPGPDVSVDEDSGSYSQAWAAGISAGPNETQSVQFSVTTDAPNLFSTPPAISPSGVLTFQPAADAFGTANLSVTLSDNGGTDHGGANTSAAYALKITINGTNDAPTFTQGPDVTVAENSGPYNQAWASTISAGPFESGQNVHFEIVSSTNPALFSSGPAIAPDGTLSFTPLANTYGTAKIVFHAKDDGGTSNGGQDTSTPDAFFNITVAETNNLSLQYNGGPAQLLSGNKGVYTFTVANTGIHPATNVVLTTTLPADLSFDSSTSDPACAAAGQNVTCNIASIDVGSTAPIQIGVLVNPALSKAEDLSFTVHAAADQLDPDLKDNDATASLQGVLSLVVYNNDFETSAGAEWTDPKLSKTPSGRQFLGQLNNQSVTLGLKDLQLHRKATVEFDLYIIGSWDGSEESVPQDPSGLISSIEAGGSIGPDVWDFLEDNHLLLHTTFSNWDSFHQAYPEWYPQGYYEPRTGSSEQGTLGYQFGAASNLDTVYHLTYTFDHAEDALNLTFRDLGLQGMDDESWGLDNVRVTIESGYDPKPNKIYFPLIAR